MNKSITVLIPAYNEEKTIAKVISEVKAVLDAERIQYEILVIDDGSTDQTHAEASRSDVRIIRHEKNRGYGASLKTGIIAARSEVIVIIDSDGTYPAEGIPEMIKALESADMVVGARIGKDVAIPLIRQPAKWLLKHLAEYITGERIPDLNSGLRAFRRSVVLQYLPLLSEKFSFTTSLTVGMLSSHYTVSYLSTNYYKRIGKSKIRAMNFVEFIILVLRLSMLFNPLKVFVPVSLFCFMLGSVKFTFDLCFALEEAGGITFEFISNKVISQSALILWLASLQTLLVGMVADGIVLKIGQRLSQVVYTDSPHKSTSEK